MTRLGAVAEEQNGGMDVVVALVGLGPVLLLLTLLVLRTRQLWWRQPVTSFKDWPGSGGETAGDREPRRPLVPAGAGAVALQPPEGEENDVPGVARRDHPGGEPARRLRAS